MQGTETLKKAWFYMKIGLLGHGTVGRGVDDVIRERVPSVEVKRILELPDRLTDSRMTADINDIVSDPEIELVVECMGGIEPAHDFIVRALNAGKHVVTSNKAVVAAHFAEFVRLADEHGVSFLVEAAVGGGVPWIASVDKMRRIDEISSFAGIMNGTTNYIIDNMRRSGVDFDIALARAQELGYAERDPSADIDGIDVANKTIISACVAFDVDCVRDLPVTGIRTLTKADLDLFAKRNLTVKLFGRGVCSDGRYAVSVEPVAVSLDSLEAAVPTNFNIVSVIGDTVGPLKFYGQGAGSLPTGNAIVQDVLDVVEGRHQHYDFTRDLTYDPTLLRTDYVIRSSVRPANAEQWYAGAWIVRDLDAVAACEMIRDIWSEDPSAFMAAFPQGEE